MNKIENLSVQQNKILEEEQQLLLQVKQGLLMHAAEEKKGEISKTKWYKNHQSRTCKHKLVNRNNN